MQKTTLGDTDLHTAPIVFGGNVFGWTADEDTSFRLLDRFFDLGFNAVDTADIYSRWVPEHEGGESEALLGRWMKARGNRDRVLLCTKVGGDMGEGKCLKEEYVLRRADDSLRRLGTDHIDLYFTHWDDGETPVEETLGAYQKLIDAGKVRHVGASNLSPERLRESLDTAEREGLPRYRVFQPEYNLYDREGFENGIQDVCEEHGLGVVTYFSLASGFLTGKYRGEDDFDKSVRGGRMDKYLDERGRRILAALDDVSAAHDTTPAAVALAWLIAQPSVTAPIASATKESHLDAFEEAVGLELSEEETERLEDASR